MRWNRQKGARDGDAGGGFEEHVFPTTPMADIIQKLVPEVKVFGSVCLDNEIGD